MRQKRLRKLVWVLLGFVGLYLGVCLRLALAYVHPARVIPATPEWVSEVDIPTRFGPTPAWISTDLAKGRPSPVVFVLAHGYGGTRATWSEPMRDLESRRFDSVAIAMPGQDASPARSVGFGIAESHVIVDTVKWVRSRVKSKVKVVVLGLSMGGAAAWIASEEDPAIDGVITEGAFASFSDAMNSFFDRKLPGGRIILSPVVTMAKWMTGLEPSHVRPVEQAARWRGRPALVIQGANDTLIKPFQGEALAKAAGCPIWLAPGVEHARCYEQARGEYLEKITSFANALS